MNSVMNEPAVRELNLQGGERILDVGSGLGQLTRGMARAAGREARVVGIERDDQQLKEAIRCAREAGEENLVEWRKGDALTLPLQAGEWGVFDIAHARFVLEHVPDPVGVVRQMVQAVHPGGRIVLQDDDHDVLRLYPEPPGFPALWHAYIRTYDRLGNDPFVGRRLVSILHQAGAVPVRNTWIFFGSCSGNPTFAPLVANALGILNGAKEAILSQGLLDPALFEAGVKSVDQWAQRPDAGFWYSICWAEGKKPGELA
jgi:SAM-dependent methyltransferase